MVDLLAPPAPRRRASASMRLRRRWAFHRTLTDFLWLIAAVGTFKAARFIYAAGRGGWDLFAPALFFGGAVFIVIMVVRDLRRMGRYLRGRGEPSEELLLREMSEGRTAGFTLAAATVLVMIAAPAFEDLPRKSIEGQTRQTLSVLRERIIGEVRKQKRHYGVTPRIPLENVPAARLPRTAYRRWHPDSSAVLFSQQADDSGGWAVDPDTGLLFVNCTHTDAKGKKWAAY
jgi:hypothetical protein